MQTIQKLLRVGYQTPVLISNLMKEPLERGRIPKFPSSAEKLLDAFYLKDNPSFHDYSLLFKYFALGWLTYRSPCRTRAKYPGLPSWSGMDSDAVEGFSRMMPFFGAWCRSGRGDEINFENEKKISLTEEFRRGLIAGTDKNSPSYWGGMPGKHNQMVVEAADIAFSLWLFRDTVWPSLTSAQQENVLNWLLQVKNYPCLHIDNNWHLFFIMVDRVLAAFGVNERLPGIRERWERVKSFYLGDGWYEDGVSKKVDYYNVFAFHYSPYWYELIDPEWDPIFIRESQRLFLSSYKYFITPRGIPILGRSVAYRLSAPGPLVFGHMRYPDLISAGLARRAMDAVWTYFIRHGAVSKGTVTQGYFETDARMVDNYSGPASVLWAFRSLIPALSLPETHPFWTCEPEPLPIEQGDFALFLEGPQWKVWGEQKSHKVTIEVLNNHEDVDHAVDPFCFKRRLKGLIEGEPCRPWNGNAKYKRRIYSNDPPFCV